MTTDPSRITLSLGDLDGVRDWRELRLPVIPHLGVAPTCRRAVDAAVEQGRGVLVVAPKGMGKTFGLDRAEAWFNEIERAKRQHNESYRIRRLKSIRYARDEDYRETAVLFARSLNPQFHDRVRGKRKSANQIREEVVQLVLKSSYVAMLVDEVERLTDESLLFIRDLMADAEGEDRRRDSTANTLAAGGVGFVLVGTPEVQDRLVCTTEAGHRWAQVMAAPPLDPQQVCEIYSTWIPAAAGWAAELGAEAAATYFGGLMAAAGGASFRLIENHVRIYALFLTRSGRGTSDLASLPFDRVIFEATLREAAWAAEARVPQKGRSWAKQPRPRSSRNDGDA